MNFVPDQASVQANSPYLAEPVTEKETLCGNGKINNQEIRWGLSSMQGWRVTMEDAHCHSLPMSASRNLGFFGIFDGHGGDFAAKFAAGKLEEQLVQTESYKKSKGMEPDDEATLLGKALMEAYVETDELLRETDKVQKGNDFSGSTGISCLVTGTHIIFANTGDSRAVLFSKNKVKFATQDQKPSDEKEKARVEAAGGKVEAERVNGDLASARSFGDFRYKRDPNLPPSKQQVTVLPEITVIPRSSEDQYIVVACDGIWDVMSNFEASHLLLAAKKMGCDIGQACEKVLDECLLKSSGDNMSIMSICFPAAPKQIGNAKKDQCPKLDIIREAMINAVI